MTRRLLPLLVLLAMLTVPAGAQAALNLANLWATVNVCDTPGAPNVIGIRASMPGNGRAQQRMYMRFEAQYYSTDQSRFVATGSVSRWVPVGSARATSKQGGFSFQFADPPTGGAYVMRGRVFYQWRAKRGRRWVVTRTAIRLTRAGLRTVKGGDPPGRSDALCLIRH